MRKILEVIWYASTVAAAMLIFVNLGALYPKVLNGFAVALIVTFLISAIGFAVAWVERRSYTEGYDDAEEVRRRVEEARLP